MGRAGNVIDEQTGDGVTAKAAGRGGMKKLRVFILFQGILDFGTHSPIDGAFLNGEVQSIHNEGAKTVFSTQERASLLQQIKKVDEQATIVLSLGMGGTRSRPLLTRGSAGA
jgi:hypothetical protein